MTAKTNKSLHRKRGASIAEFVIIAPLLVLLALVAYDLNKRVEDAQNIAIVTHNTVYVGTLNDTPTSRDFVRNRAVKSLTDYDASAQRDNGMARSVERDERQEMSLDPSRSGTTASGFRPGTFVLVSKEAKPTDTEKRRALQPSGIAPGAGTFADFYKMTTGAMNSALPAANTAMDAYNGVFGLTGLDAGKTTRSAAVEMRLSGENNALVRSIDSLGRIFGKDDGDGALVRKFSSRRYLMSKTAYHSEDYRRAAYLGAGIGLVAYGDWSGSQFDRSSGKMQERCMTKFSVEDTCETGSGSREFMNAVTTIAGIRYAISVILTAFVFTKPADVAISVAGDIALQAVFSTITGSLYSTLEQQIAQQVAAPKARIEQEMTNGLTSGMQSFGSSFLPDTAPLANGLGE